MTKADKRALAYAKSHAYLEYDYDQTYDAVKYGYLQAEKDLALTWEDVKLIVECYNKAADSPSTIQWGLGSDIHCEDALYLYNKKKQAKEINKSKTSMSNIGKD